MKKTAVTVATAALLSAGFSTTALADTYHQVQSGDTLSKIAKKYNTSVSSLKNLNGLSSDLIFVNQKLKVSASGSGVSQSTVSQQSGTSALPSSGTVSSGSSAGAAKTYRVVSGDTLSKIANNHGISLAELKQWNNIESHLIYPGQVLLVSKPVSGGSSAPVSAGAQPSGGTVKPAPENSSSGVNTAQPSISNNAGGSKYVIKSGDTLGKISKQVGVSVAELKSLNHLSSDLIYAGQTLIVSAAGGSEWASGSGSVSSNSGTNGSGVSGVKETTAKGQTGTGTSVSGQVSVDKVIAEAKKLIGIPYVYGGQTTAGFDCSGFIYYVYKMAGSTMSRQSSDGYYNRSYYIDSPQVGDLVFFQNTYRQGISHLGIYLGNNQFIHAGSSGVMISNLTGYWKDHFASFKRFY